MASVYREGMTEERHVKTVQSICGAAIGYYRIVQQQHGSQMNVIASTSGVQFPIGVTRDNSENPTKTTYEANDPVELAYDGIVYVTMEGSGYRSNRVMAGTDGKGVNFVPRRWKACSGDDQPPRPERLTGPAFSAICRVLPVPDHSAGPWPQLSWRRGPEK